MGRRTRLVVPLFQPILNDPARHQALLNAVASERRLSRRQEHFRRSLQGAIRDFFRTLATSKDNDSAASPLPRVLSSELADAFGALIEGFVHPLVKPAVKKPGQSTFPKMRECQVKALHYIESAKRGVLQDPHPVKTVIEAFGISRRLLLHWRKALGRELAAAISSHCPAPDFIVPREMRNAAISYRRWRNVD